MRADDGRRTPEERIATAMLALSAGMACLGAVAAANGVDGSWLPFVIAFWCAAPAAAVRLRHRT